MIRTLSIAAAASAFFMTPACAQEVQVETSDRAAIELIVREYIAENPEIIEDALIALADKREAEKAAQARQAITDRADDLFADSRDYSIGPEDAPVTIVEFLDYHCGYCKASSDWVMSLPARYDGKVRVIFKEFPILKSESRDAALAALAAGKQGKYTEVHIGFMNARGTLKASDIDRIAENAGVDVAQMRADMKTSANQQHIADIRDLAIATGTSATPTFIINGELIAGFNRARLEELIEAGIDESS